MAHRPERLAIGDDAFTARAFERRRIVDVHDPAAELGRARPGELRADRRDRRARDAEEVGERLLGEREGRSVDPIVNEQQPARCALVEPVEAVAHDRLSSMGQQDRRVSLDRGPERVAGMQPRAQPLRRHRPGAAGDLDRGLRPGRYRRPGHRGEPDHS
ncbi:MAG TPA: hypothetical protein VFW20_08495, partial [Candidatus Limnocylindrales bacterium]|nr:hypothetical protein [Candidatus Limnocylindrales bacterium]